MHPARLFAAEDGRRKDRRENRRHVSYHFQLATWGLQVSRFLLASLHVNSLLDKTTAKKVKATLANLLKGSASLDNAYNDALQRIRSQLDGHYDLAKNVLSWIVYARRPLTTAELCCALAVEPGNAELDPDNLPDFKEMLSVCAGLVVVDRESDVIRLVHYTTQEYFERIRDTWNPDAPLHIASTCLTYLSFDLFKTGSCSNDEDYEQRLWESKFLDYAAKHWGEHAVTFEKKLCAMICSFLSDDGLVSSAIQVFLAPTHKYYNYSQRYPKNSTGAHLGARFGLSITLETMLLPKGQERKPQLAKKDSEDQTSLYLAAENGHYLTAELLINMGAEVNAQGGVYGNALQAASYRGHEAIVKLLLEKGAELNAQGRHFGNALQAASSKGHETTVKILLDNGADIYAQYQAHRRDYQATQDKRKRQDLMKKLVYFHGMSRSYRGAVDNAIAGGHAQIVHLLLERNPKVKLESEDLRYALYGASERGHLALVNLLLESGAEVNAQGRNFNNALQAASFYGHEAVVKLLLESSAEVNVQGGYYRNALQAASFQGHEAVVKLLLESSAEVNVQGGHYRNALQAASFQGHEAVVKLLLKSGAKINAQGGYYRNALQAASFQGHEAVVKLLLKSGAEVNAQGGYYRNALQAASFQGHEAVVKLLLKSGAEVNAQGGYYGNALQTASSHGYNTTVKLLLESGAEINAQGGYYGNALQAASSKGYRTTVKLLLKSGAKVNGARIATRPRRLWKEALSRRCHWMQVLKKSRGTIL
jgi:ankyrin repeat protein